jgi:uncharacterized protein (DUF433 family)
MTRNFGCTKVMVRAYEASGLCPSRGSGCGLHRAMDAMETARLRQCPQGGRHLEWTLAHPRRKDIVLPDNVSVPVSMSRKHVAEGLLRLRQATSAIVSDPKTLQGAPCFRGTRIPVHTVAEIAIASGVDAAKTTYARLTRSQIERACLYAKAYPRRGRPKRAGDILAKRKPKSSKTVSVSLD